MGRGEASGGPGDLSELASDPEMREILETYVDTLSARATELTAAAAAGDCERLRFLLHQLKGTAGSYGFPWITEAARSLEKDAVDRRITPERVDALARMCRRARGAGRRGV